MVRIEWDLLALRSMFIGLATVFVGWLEHLVGSNFFWPAACVVGMAAMVLTAVSVFAMLWAEWGK